MTPKRPASPLPPRRLLAIAAALALTPALPSFAATPPAPSSPATAPQRCPLGSFRCPPRPLSFAMCRPNALLEFYDPTLPTDSTLRDAALTYVNARHVDGSSQTQYRLTGDVDIVRADQRLRADQAVYNDQTTDYDALGSVRYQDASQLLAADHMRGNQQASRSIADNVRFQLLNSHGNGTAARGEALDADHNHYTQVSYSTCDVGHHLWEVRAKDLVTDKTTGEGVAHSATMRLAGVPLIYLPRFSFPLDDRRKSGFLYPTIANGTHTGLMASLPYYFNLAPNYDATLDPRIYTSRGDMLGGEFRYLLPQSHGQLNFEYLPDDRGTFRKGDPAVENTQGQDRWLLKLNDSTHLWGPWSLDANINRVSDKNYLRDFGNDMYTSATSTLTSSTYVHGGGNWWNASFGVDSYQNTDPYLSDSVVQYKRWPRATFGMTVPLTRWLDVGLTSEAVAFRKDDNIEGQRFDLYPYLGADFRGAAWFVRPKIAYRYTAYDFSNDRGIYGYYGRLSPGAATPFTSDSPSRSLPIASVDAGLIFDRAASLFGNSYTQTLEPRLYYLYVPYRNQNNLPLFDTNLMTFDYWQLFAPNRYSGADRQMDANNLTAALTTRLLDDNGVERVSASIGQIRYFSHQRVQLPNGQNTTTPATDWTGSNYVAQLGIQLNDDWRLDSSYQWNPHKRTYVGNDVLGDPIYAGHNTDMAALQIQRRIGGDGIVNFSYRYRRGLLEQYDASAVYPVSAAWRLLGRWTYSELEKRTVEVLGGVEYEGCCMTVRLVGRHYVDSYNYVVSQAHANNAVMFEIEFKGLGTFNGQLEDVLRRGILGYQ
ncbi:LPS-assembly protein LptD [Aerosticca soli]|uniref:LPS-assembly protein LptD n=1 Tax=Aerosticca soli TaxID=2010829 RepID=A0A2Z6E6Z5_9GAMM|nr:LPS assembly protein LptD [Aerosticca soli]MDI3262267.1 LPS assembly protein LptD [Fulvimonas sp.]BBD80945.1 outer membrane protein Imp [Aerosticca soli]